MFRPLVFTFALILPGCTEHGKPPLPRQEEVTVVSPEALVRIYRDLSEADRIYTDRLVSLEFPPGTYRVDRSSVGWLSGLPNAPPVIVCEAPLVSVDSSKRLEIVGRCRGRVYDGQSRGSGINWCLRVTECSVTIR